MNYKERMIDELIGLSEKIGKLDVFLDINSKHSSSPNEETEKKVELMFQQRDCMTTYRNILCKRIILEFYDGKAN